MRFLPFLRPIRACSLTALLALGASTSSRADFVDVTPASMANADHFIGAAWADYDGDGDPDIGASMYSGTAPAVKLFRNDGSGSFANVSAILGPAAGRSGGLSFGDSDEDGDLDLVANGITNGGFLFRNNGTGTFNNIATAAFTTGGPNGRTVAWADYDRDGDCDVFLADASTGSRLLRNNGVNSFADVTPPILNVDTQAAAWADYDEDGDPDLYLGFAGGRLARNDGGGVFVDVAGAAGVSGTGFWITTNWGDFNNDGRLDLYAATGGTEVHLYRNNGTGTFTEVTPAVMAGTQSRSGATWADLDNDGDLDLYQGGYSDNDSHLFRNDGGTSFVDIVTAPLATLPSDGVPAADFDGDGDLDLFAVCEYPTTGPSHLFLFRNDLAGSTHWLDVDLRGTISNSFGIGARITAVAGGLTQTREVTGGNGWADGSVLTSHFGLGSATTVTSLTIRWPSGIVQTLSNLASNRVITVTEPGFTLDPLLAGGFPAGTPFDLRLERKGVNVTNAILSSRPAGSGAAYSLATMTIDAGADRLIAPVTGSAASQNGLEYAVLYQVNGGNVRLFPRNATLAPLFAPASLSLGQPAASPANEYVMFSVPFGVTNGTLAGVLEDDLGGYDKRKWRFGRYSPSAATYLEGAIAPPVAPGRGYWLIQKNPAIVDASGTSQNTVGGTSIPIDPGWNEIGHPYLFNVATSAIDFSQATHVVNRFVGREGSGYADKTVLEPWKGYWVLNSGSGTESIVVPGLASSAPSPAPSTERYVWAVEVCARAASSVDRGNLAGASHDADAASLTLAEPPGLPGTVRAFFARESESIREWTTDVRPVGSASESFDLVVETGEESATLTFDQLETLPQGSGAVLLSEESLAAIDVTSSTELTIPAHQTLRFRLVVGDASSLEAARSGWDHPPSTIRLATPYPNPFSGATTIAFALPQRADAHVAVFDVTGRLVRTLQRGTQPAGIQRTSWDGRDQAGARLAAGIFFVKLTVGSVEETRKVVLVR